MYIWIYIIEYIVRKDFIFPPLLKLKCVQICFSWENVMFSMGTLTAEYIKLLHMYLESSDGKLYTNYILYFYWVLCSILVSDTTGIEELF